MKLMKAVEIVPLRIKVGVSIVALSGQFSFGNRLEAWEDTFVARINERPPSTDAVKYSLNIDSPTARVSNQVIPTVPLSMTNIVGRNCCASEGTCGSMRRGASHAVP